MVALLEPFEEITRQISSDNATSADVIPMTALQMTLERQNNDSGVQTMENVLLSDIKNRFTNMYDQPPFVLATVVDPESVLKFFSEAQQQSATQLLITEVHRVAEPATDSNGELPPVTKRPRFEDARKLTCAMQEIVSRGLQTEFPDSCCLRPTQLKTRFVGSRLTMKHYGTAVK